MIIEDVWFELKDGRKALLRSPKEEDIERLAIFCPAISGAEP